VARSKPEEAFIDQYTRKLTVEWAKQTSAWGQINEPTKTDLKNPLLVACFEHAKAKGWVGKSKPARLTAKGFGTAAAFLKR